jgi:hypothetical protein
MIGITKESFVYTAHVHYNISRMNPAYNLQKITIKNIPVDAKEMKLVKINRSTIVFNPEGALVKGSMFLKILIKKMILEW